MSDQTTSEPTMGPTGLYAVAPSVVAVAIALATVGLVALAYFVAGWILAPAVILMVIGVTAVATYMEHVTTTRHPHVSATESPAVSESSHNDLSIHDLPPDNPARHELAQIATAAQGATAADEPQVSDSRPAAQGATSDRPEELSDSSAAEEPEGTLGR